MSGTHYPTDLSAAEDQHARARLAELADGFIESGDLRSAEWREAFLSTWRHPYIPAYYPALDRPPVLCINPDQRAGWLDNVYSDQTLITKVMPKPLSRVFRPALGWVHTSSSTLPSLVLRMLEALDVHDGMRVLEIGTGSGYNCALLCQRLGSELVTSVDVDAELVDLARERLSAQGFKPHLVAVDGAEGHPAGGPYDRIISTCAVPAIPTAWLGQVAPGGVILTDVHGALGGTLVRLTLDDNGVATGHFLPFWTGFIPMRHADPGEPTATAWSAEEPTSSTTDVDPSMLLDQLHPLGFVAQWQLPGVQRAPAASETGEPAVTVWAADGSEATVETTEHAGRYRVSETGPRRIWQDVELIHEFWQSARRPGFERFGLTATPTGQWVWLDDPDSSDRWAL